MPGEVVAGMRQSPFWPALEATANPGLRYDAEIVGDWAVAAAAPKGARQTLTGQQHNVESAALAPALATFFTGSARPRS